MTFVRPMEHNYLIWNRMKRFALIDFQGRNVHIYTEESSYTENKSEIKTETKVHRFIKNNDNK